MSGTEKDSAVLSFIQDVCSFRVQAGLALCQMGIAVSSHPEIQESIVYMGYRAKSNYEICTMPGVVESELDALTTDCATWEAFVRLCRHIQKECGISIQIPKLPDEPLKIKKSTQVKEEEDGHDAA